MTENTFQGKLIKELKDIFPGCIITHNDPEYIQGIPDLFIFYKNKWAALECKRSLTAKHRPNQDYYVNKMNDMSFAAFICPENKEEIIDGLRQTFQS